MLPFGKAFAISAIGLMALHLGSLAPIAPKAAPQDVPARPEFYTAHVAPIFEANCTRCHGGLNHRGGFNMNSRATMLQGGHHGAALVPGDPEHSLLVKLIRHEGPVDDPMDMPPKKPKLTDADIATVSQWVKAGAPMPPPANP